MWGEVLAARKPVCIVLFFLEILYEFQINAQALLGFTSLGGSAVLGRVHNCVFRSVGQSQTNVGLCFPVTN